MATVRKSQNGWPVHPTSAGCVSLSWITGRVGEPPLRGCTVGAPVGD